MVIVFGALWMANRMQMHRQEMTYTEFVKQVEAENVTEVYIDQNKAVPTGTVVFALKDTDENRSVNVSNVEKVEKLLDKTKFYIRYPQFRKRRCFLPFFFRP